MKLGTPSTFDGKDPHKIREFLGKLRNIFLADPTKFRLESQKVAYACSFMTAAPFDWAQNILFDDSQAALRHNFAAFESSFLAIFGNPNEAQTSKTKLRCYCRSVSSYVASVDDLL
ncbi:BQ5605_C015g07724 [Microbotryum silenes-dioicae]|uniref:BQ5605_C015g07724 protein n=1 Tax=Microbotryum silenes-dioicae TaxID=796604 RepID=A0A2X0MMD4_9BASI|nr:BQ5605_C015g07724 [Microbotryum silenes-dioicae]